MSDAVAIAASFHEQIRAQSDDMEQARRFPQALASRMAAAGMFRLLVPDCYHGAQVHPQAFFDALATTAEADGAAGWCQMIAVTTGLMSATLPEPWAQKLYGENPDVITTGVTAPIGRAARVSDGLLVSGRWPFGSGCQISDWICGGVMIDGPDGPERNEQGVPRTLLVFFPASEVTIHDQTWQTSGLRGTGSHDIEVNEQLVPEGRWVEMGTRPRVDAPLYRFPTLGLLALGVSAVAIGIARHAISAFVELASGKVPTGSGRTLAERAAAQKDLAQASALVQSAAALTREAIDESWATASAGEKLSTEHKARLRLAATNNAWSAAEAVDLVYHAAGGSAIYDSSPLQRCFRDVHVATQHIMVAQPTYEVVGRVQLGMPPRSPL
jgi:indole-3-acetate monooxygenase